MKIPTQPSSRNVPRVSRRKALSTGLAALGASSLSPLPFSPYASATDGGPRVKGSSEHVIMIWLGGGMGQIDTFDAKRRGDPKSKTPGSYYASIDTAVPGVQVCEHLSKTAAVMDRITAVRSVHHEMIDEHAAATNRMHTGRPISGTVTYPSIGSLITHERGAASEGAPPYVLIGYPNVTRGPGFLGAKYGYLYLTETGQGPAGLSLAQGIDAKRQRRREEFLSTLRRAADKTDDQRLLDYQDAIQQSIRLSGPAFADVFQLESEPASLRNRYGGEFGQRCLLSRRLIERGVRFVEVSHNLNFLNGAGWDAHNEAIEQQYLMIQELDSALSALIRDLDDKRLLEKTLIVVNTEFGRPPEFDSGGGRGHQGTAFTCVLAGGGLAHRGAWGVTDELSKTIVSDPVSVPDFFATILAAVGVDYSKNLFSGDRPVPMTDMGEPIRELFV